MDAISHIPDQPWLCAAFVSGTCELGLDCSNQHNKLPYLWQVKLDHIGWISLLEDLMVKLEVAYCTPGSVGCHLEIPITYNDGVVVMENFTVDLDLMVGQLQHPPHREAEQTSIEVRRLSTPSYASSFPTASQAASQGDQPSAPPLSACPWRWYYDALSGWNLFEEDDELPMQYVLEEKYLAGQKIYRFELEHPHLDEPAVFLLNFTKMSLLNLTTQVYCLVRRRPLYVSPDYCLLRKFPPLPPSKPNHWGSSKIPRGWFPIDQKAEYELVPLDPESSSYHFVASAFVSEKLPNWKILDIYRLQNPFLWHKFQSKKDYMEQKRENANELMLFHGTEAETSVQAIFRQNFDWRLSGKNAVAYGDGSYFAGDPGLSDKYTGGGHVVRTRWMFLARVLVGVYALGRPGYKRPPPQDPARPYGDLYDSCVNRMRDPSIYVVFDSDQCYPEYAISYTR